MFDSENMMWFTKWIIILILLGGLSYQSSVIRQQRSLIQQMSQNPACLQ